MTRAELITTWLLTEIERQLQAHGVTIAGDVAAALGAAWPDCHHLIHTEINDAQREARDEVWGCIDNEDYGTTAPADPGTEFTKAMRGFIKQQARFRHGPE